MRHLVTNKNRLRFLHLIFLVDDPAAYVDFESDLIETEDELARLQHFPDLFMSQDLKAQFWQSVYTRMKDLAHLMEHSQGLNTDEHERVMDDVQEYFEWAKLPSRQPHLSPWEQFLNNKAPGSGIDFSKEEIGSVHVLPYAACRIMRSVKAEMAYAARMIERVSQSFCNACVS